MKIKYLYFCISFLFVSPLLASEQEDPWNWTGVFPLNKVNVEVEHTSKYVRFDTEIATQICIPKGSDYNDFIFSEALFLSTHVSREEFIQHLIDSGLYEVPQGLTPKREE